MLLFRYLGEALVINPWAGFAVGLCGWFFILFFIVSIGWSIYPLGYFFGYLQGVVSDAPLNLIYNVADFVNKIWFCLAIWGAAKTETLAAIASGSIKDPLLG